MNRIYQGRVTGVSLADGAPLIEWEKRLWDHHALFQDAVNYYVVALAALGSGGEGELTDLRDRLRSVWDLVEKPGERRPGMCEALARRFAIPTVDFTLERAIELTRNGDLPNATEAEKYGNYILRKARGAGAIRNAAREFLPQLCDPACTANFPGNGAAEKKAAGFKRLQTELHDESLNLEAFAARCSLAWVVKLSPGAAPWSAGERLQKAVLHFLGAFGSTPAKAGAKKLGPRTRQWLCERADGQASLEQLDAELRAAGFPDAEIPRSRRGTADLTEALLLFKYFPRPFTRELLQFLFPKPQKPAAKAEPPVKPPDAARARGERGYVIRAFTTFSFFGGSDAGDFNSSGWRREFDIAAFKEALTVANQFTQNLEKREEKITRLAARLLLMAGPAAADDVSGEEAKCRIAAIAGKGRSALVNLSAEKEDHEEADVGSWPRFEGEPRIERLRQIISQDLADDNDGRAYGLRRRTMKGWGTVRSAWRKIAKDSPFSVELRARLQAALNDLRNENSEGIGSARLFEALIADEAAWGIWRRADGADDEDLLDNFRRYCEAIEELESRIARSISFTPADPVRSRRLFSFSDACSFGKKKGEFRHDADTPAAMVPLAVADGSGRFVKRTVRLKYAAPRLLRDRLRSETGQYVKTWSQPMADALWAGQPAPSQPAADLDGAAIELMPDWDRDGNRRFLLNFSLDLSAEALSQQVRKARGQGSLPAGFTLSQSGRWNLRWPSEPGDPPKHPWWAHLQSFTTLGVDLGVRQAAAAALVEATAGSQSGPYARLIGEAGGEQWHAHYRAGSLLRLPGEERKVWRDPTRAEAAAGTAAGKALREELHGSRGRTATEGETAAAATLITDLGYAGLAAGLAEASFPQQNDKLLVAIRWKQRQMARENRWLWLLAGGTPEQKTKVLADVAATEPTLAQDPTCIPPLRMRVEAARVQVQRALLAATERILPLRGRNWGWVELEDRLHFANCHCLRLTVPGTGPTNKKLAGQRGLSIARIEQLIDLRRRWQSLNQALRRQPGVPPPPAAELRQHPIPDPCPDILRKLDQIREQRVNQTAHLILAEALGVRLRRPAGERGANSPADRHGRYESFRPPVDLIVIENLSRYRTSQGRAHSENSSLMQWCHRQVAHKLAELAEPFGIPVLDTPAAYSSRFCSFTGAVGFRATEVTPADRGRFPWRKLLKEASDEGAGASTESKQVAKLFQQLDELNADHGKRSTRTLLAPQAGGPIFVRAVAGKHETMQADLNAAINLALRAVAAPDRPEMHHRVRTERGSGGKYVTREPRRGTEVVTFDATMPATEKFPNIFADAGRIAQFNRARLGDDKAYEYATWPALDTRIKQIRWQRCNEINQHRMSKWRSNAAKAAGHVF
ncbi:MAG: type V CRISPR-associated protein Cas12b [Terriglobales bacterium]